MQKGGIKTLNPNYELKVQTQVITTINVKQNDTNAEFLMNPGSVSWVGIVLPNNLAAPQVPSIPVGFNKSNHAHVRCALPR